MERQEIADRMPRFTRSFRSHAKTRFQKLKSVKKYLVLHNEEARAWLKEAVYRGGNQAEKRGR